MQDLSAAFPSLKQADTLAPPARAADEGVRRTWQQSLGDVHVRLNNIVGAAPLLLRFDANDSDFVFELTSHWPLSLGARRRNTDNASAVQEAEIIKLADALNDLVRLYAIETGHTAMHLLIEARRGQFDIPGWWVGSPCLFATYAMDTGFAEAGLFTNLADAYEDMVLLTQPHRLLVAIGPATPEMVKGSGDALLDADEDRLRALKRWNQQMALQINTLIADIFGGGEGEMEAVVGALSRIRDVSARLSAQILRLEKRAYRPKDELEAELHNMPLPSAAVRPAGKLDLVAETAPAPGIAETLADLRGALKQEAQNQQIPAEMRRELQNGLRALNNLESTMEGAPPAPVKARRKLRVATAPQMVARTARKTGEHLQRRAAFGALAAVRRIKRARAMRPASKVQPVQQQPVAAPKKKPVVAGAGPSL